MAKLQVWKYEPVPEKKGFHRFKEMCTVNEFVDHLEAYLKKQWTFTQGNAGRVYDWFDYISQSSINPEYKDNVRLPMCRQITCEVVEGSNEGHYFHIKAWNSGDEYVSLLTCKTLSGSSNIALELNYWLNRYLLEEIE